MDRQTLGGLMMIGLTFGGIYIWLTGSSAQASTSATGEIPRDRVSPVANALFNWSDLFSFWNDDEEDAGASSSWLTPQTSTPTQTNQGGDFLSQAASLGLGGATGTGGNAFDNLLGFTGGGLNSVIGNSATDVDILARTIWAEARGEGAIGMQAVANVVMNRKNDRKKRWPRTVAGVCQQKDAKGYYQFNAWGDANGAQAQTVTIKTASFASAVDVAAKVVSGALGDLTGGACHYYAVGPIPYWDKAATSRVQIGQHIFCVGVP